jgi:alkylhydroperoxidase family enzyme
VKALASNPSLPAPVREIAILVTGAHFRSAYELYAHVIVAENRGLSDDKLATIVAGQRPANLTATEGVAYDMAAALVNGGVLPELTWRAVVAAFGPHGAAELFYLLVAHAPRGLLARAAIRKRSAVSCGAEKLSSPHLVATKAKRQTSEVSAASIVSRIAIADPPAIYTESIIPRASRRFCTRPLPVPLVSRRSIGSPRCRGSWRRCPKALDLIMQSQNIII